jgi:hypothetical protein
MTHLTLVVVSNAKIVRILLRYAPTSAFVFTDEGFSALDVHIMSYSRFHKQKEQVFSCGRTSTVVLRTLLEEAPALADARVYKNKVRGPIETLHRCNMDEFKEAVDKEANVDIDGGLSRRTSLRSLNGCSILSDWWAWKWALLLLKFGVISEGKRSRPFCAVHAATRLVGCPLPILALAITTYPKQVSERDPRDELYNLPLHNICSWRCDQEIICGDPFFLSRKVKAIQCLLEEYPEAARMTNNMSETPLQLAIESCTPWHGGLEMLVRTCPKALKFPRRVRRSPVCNALVLSVPNQGDTVSLFSDDELSLDEMKQVEGMYPFMIAAVMSHVPPTRMEPPSFSYPDLSLEEHRANLAKKDLQSVRAIFGCLRAKPDALEMYLREPV